MAEIVRQVGRIDILILNAGDTHKPAPPTQLPEEDVNWMFRLNTVAPFALAKAVLSQPSGAEGVTIINVSAGAAYMRPPVLSAYGSSKAAFVQMIADFAASSKGVRAFSIHPGSFYTKSVSRVLSEDAVSWEDSEYYLDSGGSYSALTIPAVNLPAHFSVWLCSREADFLNGRFVWPQWDVDELLAEKERIEKDPNMLKLGLIM